MPYKSAAQRGFMHAQHPEIAAKWDAEIRAKKGKKKVAKNLKPMNHAKDCSCKDCSVKKSDPFEITKATNWKNHKQRERASTAGALVGGVGGAVAGFNAGGAAVRARNAAGATKSSYKVFKPAMNHDRKAAAGMAGRMGATALKTKTKVGAAHGAGMYGGLIAGSVGGAMAGEKLMRNHQRKVAAKKGVATRMAKNDPFEITKSKKQVAGTAAATTAIGAGGYLTASAVGQKVSNTRIHNMARGLKTPGKSYLKAVGRGLKSKKGIAGGTLAAVGFAADHKITHASGKRNSFGTPVSKSAFGVVHPDE